MKNKQKQPKYILKTGYSEVIFTTPAILLLFCFLFLLLNGVDTIFFILLGFSIIVLISTFFLYKTKELVITNNKIYVFQGKQKIFGWTFLDDFNVVDFKQSKFGEKFNYGTLFISNRNNKIFLFKNIKNPLEAYETIIIQYEKIMCLVDESYTPKYKKRDNTNSSNSKIIIKNGVSVDRVQGDNNEK